MSEPPKRIRDSILFDYVLYSVPRRSPWWIVNFIGEAAGSYWILDVEAKDVDGIGYLEMSLVDEFSYQFIGKHWQCLISVVNQDPSKSVTKIETKCELEKLTHEKFMRLDEIFSENSGFLIDEKLRIRIEIRVTSIIDYDGDVHLNIDDRFENCITIRSMDGDGIYYANKQLMAHHCGGLRSDIMAGKTKFIIEDSLWQVVHEVLQCIHGSPCFRKRFHPEFRAYHLKLAELWQITRFKYTLKTYKRDGNPEPDAFGNDLMKHRLKMIDNVQQLQEKVQIWNMEKLNEETIKKIVQKFFSFDWRLLQLEHASNPWDLQKNMENWKLEDLELEMMQAVTQKFFSFDDILAERFESVNMMERLEELQELIGKWEIGGLDRNITKATIEKCFTFAIDYRTVAMGGPFNNFSPPNLD